MDLLNRKCTLIEGGKPPLTRKEIGILLKEVPDWSLEDGHLLRRFTFRDFKECVKFMDGVVGIATEEGHYPDICISNARYVDILLYTYAIGGLSLNDFILAAKIVHRLVHAPASSGM